MNISQLDTVLFIYAKNGKAKILNLQESMELESKLLSKNWVHTATIDPLLYLNSLLGLKNKDVIKELKLLKGVK